MAEPRLVRNPWSIAGAWLTTFSAIAFIAYYVADALDLLGSPYSGLVGFLALPALFVLGLLLIPFGIWWEGRRRPPRRRAQTSAYVRRLHHPHWPGDVRGHRVSSCS